MTTSPRPAAAPAPEPRMAVVPDYAWPAPSHRHGEERPKMDVTGIATMSQWLIDAEIPVEGVDTFIADAAE